MAFGVTIIKKAFGSGEQRFGAEIGVDSTNSQATPRVFEIKVNKDLYDQLHATDQAGIKQLTLEEIVLAVFDLSTVTS